MKNKDSKSGFFIKTKLATGILILLSYSLVIGYFDSLKPLAKIENLDLPFTILSKAFVVILINFILYLIFDLKFEKFVNFWIIVSLAHTLSFIVFCLIAGKLEPTNVISTAGPYLTVLMFYELLLD
jgi:hypothetical protein